MGEEHRLHFTLLLEIPTNDRISDSQETHSQWVNSSDIRLGYLGSPPPPHTHFELERDAMLSYPHLQSLPIPLEQSMCQMADIQQEEEAPTPRRQPTGILPSAAQPNHSPNHCLQ